MATILLVEDERVTQRRIQKMLEDAGYSVHCTDDGVDAMRALEEEEIDLVLLDIWLPKMSGLEVLAEMKQRKLETKVVVMTADDTPETILNAVSRDAYHYVPKPVEPKELLAVCEKALTKSDNVPRIRVLSAKPEWVELAVPCDRDAAERIQSFLSRLDTDLEPSLRESIGRVFREMLLNAIEWGGKLDPKREVRVTYLRARKMLLYRIADPGEGFRFEDLDHAAISNPKSEPMGHMQARSEKGLRPGGFGILMSKTLADELIYNEARNEVVFVKYLEDAEASKKS